MTVFWPVAALVMISGFLLCWWRGFQTLKRVLREGSQARQGMFLWSASLLWYGCMCIGGLGFHCLHIRTIPHILDLVGTGLSSLSVIAGFAAFTGKIDDRTLKQRLGFLLAALAFTVVAIISPPLLQELLYVVPALLATGAAVRFLRKSSGKHREAQRWLFVAGLGIVLGLGVLPLDKYLCDVVGANFMVLFWFFLGCNLAILSTHQFALVVADKNLHFTDLKTQ